MGRTKIDWCDWVMNPVWGCTGSCPYCYARKMAKRRGKIVCGRNDFVPTWIESNFQKPIPKTVKYVFVNSMSDIADWEPEWIARVMTKVSEYPDKLFLFLSKRPWQCVFNYALENAMLGYSVTRQSDIYGGLGRKGDPLFLSIEPFLEHIKLPARWHPRWIIVGAETGNRTGKVVPKPEWLLDIYEYAIENKIPLFFKKSLRNYWPYFGYDYFPQEYPE